MENCLQPSSCNPFFAAEESLLIDRLHFSLIVLDKNFHVLLCKFHLSFCRQIFFFFFLSQKYPCVLYLSSYFFNPVLCKHFFFLELAEERQRKHTCRGACIRNAMFFTEIKRYFINHSDHKSNILHLWTVFFFFANIASLVISIFVHCCFFLFCFFHTKCHVWPSCDTMSWTFHTLAQVEEM